MVASARVEVDFVAQTAAFNANISKAAANLNSNAAKMNRSLASISNGFKLLGGGVAGLGLVAISQQIGRVAAAGLEHAASLAEQSQQLGVTSKDLQVYRYAAGQVGISQADMEKGLQKLTRSLGDASVGAAAPKAAFKALGISVRDASGNVKTAGTVIPEIAKAFDKVTSPAQRAAAEVALFGKAGQQLDNLLGGGSAQLEALTQAAQDLGLVLSEDQIANADKTADKIRELKEVLEANIAGAIANNAQAIYGFVDALEHLIAKIPDALNQLKLFRAQFNEWSYYLDSIDPLGSGQSRAEGAIMSKVAGNQATILKSKIAGRDAVNAMSPKDRAFFLANAPRSALKGLGFEVPGLGTKPTPKNTDLSNFKASPGPKGPKSHADRDLEDFQQQQAQLATQLLQARRANLFDVDAQLAIDKQIAGSEADTLEASIRKKATSNKIVKAHLAELLGTAAQIEAQKLLTLDTQAQEQKAKDAVELQTAANDNARDILQAQEASARTAKERRTIELKLLDLDMASQRLKLQEILDSKTANAKEKELARQGLDALVDINAARREGIINSTAGPLGQFVNGLPQNQGEIRERQEQVIVDRVQRLLDATNQFADSFAASIRSGVDDLLQGKSIIDSLKDVIGGLAQTFQKAFILDPLQEFVRNKISGPIAEKLFHVPAGVNGLTQKETNDALAAVQGRAAASLTVFDHAVDAAAAALQRLAATNGSVSIAGGGHDLLGSILGIAAHASGGIGNPDGVAQFNPAAVFNGGLSGIGFASGGRPPLGQWSLVGEHGPELFRPDGPGTILPHSMSMNVARLAANNNRRGGDTYHVNVSGAMSDRDARRTGTQIAAAMRQEQARTAKVGF